jgi:hypothetical protein
VCVFLLSARESRGRRKVGRVSKIGIHPQFLVPTLLRMDVARSSGEVKGGNFLPFLFGKVENSLYSYKYKGGVKKVGSVGSRDGWKVVKQRRSLYCITRRERKSKCKFKNFTRHFFPAVAAPNSSRKHHRFFGSAQSSSPHTGLCRFLRVWAARCQCVGTIGSSDRGRC